MKENIVVEKFRLFFKDLIILGRESLWCYENNLVMPLIYELYLNEDSEKWYQFFYDIKIKKWILTSFENTDPIIFNPKYQTGINEFLENFTYNDIKQAHQKIEAIYNIYEKFKK